MGAYKAIGMMKVKMQALKEKAPPFVTEPLTDDEIGTLVRVVGAAVDMIGILNAKVEELEARIESSATVDLLGAQIEKPEMGTLPIGRVESSAAHVTQPRLYHLEHLCPER